MAASQHLSPPDNGVEAPAQSMSQTQRARWATRRLTVKSGKNKRQSLLGRIQHGRTASTEKPPTADGLPAQPAGEEVQEADADGSELEEVEEPRTLFFNIPLPDEMKDDQGRPIHNYPRNKVRTAKYTPLSFIPKNLWFQFHNVANIFFLFLVILVFFPIFGGINPVLNAVPLIVILTLTAIKDAIEDYSRTILDIELNNAPVHILRNWENVNVESDNVSAWRHFKKANSRFFGLIWHSIESLWSAKARQQLVTRRKAAEEEDEPRPSIETQRARRSMRDSLAFSTRHSFVSAHETIQMTPVASPNPDTITFQLPTAADAERAKIVDAMIPDLVNHNIPPHGARFQKDAWKNLAVGDFVRIYNNDEIPADVIILSTSDPEGVCYAETKNLDGETNLKFRQSLRCGRAMRHARDCERAQFSVESEAPKPNLYKYTAAVTWEQPIPGYDDETEIMKEPVTIDNMLLRGCNLRNTEWVLGVVVFTGPDTKIMQNSGITPSKRPRVAREMNFSVVSNFVALSLMCIVGAVVNGVAWAKTDRSMHFFNFDLIGGSAPMSGFVTYFALIILLQNLIPISLYITLEIVRTLQAIFIYSDVQMYYEEIDQPCVPKSWNISDDVGQIEYIFSDKTGTLTQNVMEFKKATINGQPYGEAYTEAQAGMQKRLGVDVVAEGARVRAEIADAKVRTLETLRNSQLNLFLHDDDLTFIAPDFVADMNGEAGPEQQKANQEFMLALALCHTVIPERTLDDPPKMIFNAQSPDEAALVSTARDMGFTVLGSNQDGITLNVMGQERHYPILNTIEFNSSRKRMSSIVRMHDGRIVLICKGADSIIYSRLKRGIQAQLRKDTAEHLELFAREGLRTLCIAQRELTEEEYTAWKKQYDAAASAMDDREEKLESVANLIEQDLVLLGGTAIEDRLQDGVPDTIALLGDAGIKLWVLTGDKVETAINIGFSCNLLNNEMELVHLKVEEDETGETTADTFLSSVEQQLDNGLKIFGLTGSDEDLAHAKKNHDPPAPTHAIIIDGFTLRWALEEPLRQKFLLLCKQCKSVLCCRVSPAQKAAVVSMVKNSLDVMTLSIGDGANDVAMIQEADVGVGIAGLEGRQAAMSSDYAIAQFRYLQRLVLVHGRWSYRRLAECVSNFFYKNIMWTFAIFWFEVYCDFDATYPFDYTLILMFNLFFTSVPVTLMGVFDQDVPDKVSLAVPQLYRRGILRQEWTQTKFWMYMIDGVYQSVMCFFVPYLVFYMGRPASENGLDLADRLRLGSYVCHPAILTINAYILINTYQWDWIMLLVITISDLFVFFWTGVYTSFTSSGYFFGAATAVYGEASFWAVFFIVPVLCLFPRFAIKALQKVYFPYDVDIIREQWRLGQFAHLFQDEKQAGGTEAATQEHDGKDSRSNSSESSKGKKTNKHMTYGSVDEEMRPIYPPSTMTRATHNHRSQNGSGSTDFTMPRISVDIPENEPARAGRPSVDRARPSYDRLRASMDILRPSFEASNDMTSAARLSRLESTQSYNQPAMAALRTRLRGLSLSKSPTIG